MKRHSGISKFQKRTKFFALAYYGGSSGSVSGPSAGSGTSTIGSGGGSGTTNGTTSDSTTNAPQLGTLIGGATDQAAVMNSVTN